jgi:hypothetical protein
MKGIRIIQSGDPERLEFKSSQNETHERRIHIGTYKDANKREEVTCAQDFIPPFLRMIFPPFLINCVLRNSKVLLVTGVNECPCFCNVV